MSSTFKFLAAALVTVHHRFMREHLFDHVDIDPRRVHIPDGTVPAERVHKYTDAYEEAIRDAGGLDLQILVLTFVRWRNPAA